MKIKEWQIEKLSHYTEFIEGRVQFWFNKKEISKLFLEIQTYINLLNKRYSDYELDYDFSWNYHSADLYWNRPLTNEEKFKVKLLKKEHNRKERERSKQYAIKLAKKYKLIK